MGDVVSLEGLIPEYGRLFVISGPSGVGKGTVISRLLSGADRPERLVRCITATTRMMRPGEMQGRSYLFFTREEFERNAADGYFIEHVTYNDNLYGTPKHEVERERTAGDDVLLEIEVRGGLEIKRQHPDAILVFLAPPAWDALEQRLRARATEGEVAVAKRLAIAREEMRAAPSYDYLVINDDLDVAVDTLRSIIRAERCRIRKDER